MNVPVPVYGGTPPVAVTVTVPVRYPHGALTATDEAANLAVIVALAVAVHPLASVTVTLYVPAASALRFCVVAPLLHKYVYGAVPPLAVTVAVPSVPPIVVTGVDVADAVTAAG